MDIANLSANEIDELIFRLAEKRNQMNPPVPMTIGNLKTTPNASFHSQDDAAMAIGVHAETDGIRLWLRSGGLGWLEFNISQTNAIALRDRLISRYRELEQPFYTMKGVRAD